jgi:uncharacterized protein involved in type VI secretion and phage assembly
MSHRMVHAIQRIARHEMEQHANAALAVVRSVHGRDGSQTAHACTVELRETGLVLPRVPVAVGALGMAALPAQGDLVVILFVGGDLHAPVVVGRLYSEAVEPPQHTAGEVVFALPGGEDASDKSLELRVKTPGDGSRSATLVLDGSVRVAVEVDDHSVRVQAQDAQLVVRQTSSSDGSIELSAGETSISIQQSGDVRVSASGTLTLKASKIEISADTSIKLAGQTIDLN